MINDLTKTEDQDKVIAFSESEFTNTFNDLNKEKMT